MVNIAVAVVCAAIGLVALPIAFTTSALSSAAWSRPAWLFAAGLVVVVMVALFPRLSRSLAVWMGRRAPSAMPSQTRLVSQIVVLAILLVVAQAILRRPLALVLGGDRGSNTLEAVIAATALTLILALLVWLYQSGRTLLQALTMRALDAAIPTVQAAPVAEPTHTVSVADLRTPSGDATVAARSADATVATKPPNADATVLSPRRDADATVASDADETLRA